MVTRKRVESWEVSDAFWRRVEPLIPVRERSRDTAYVRRAGAGCPPKPARQVFEALWKAGLAEYDPMEGIAWRWQSIDGAMFKAPLAQEAVGRNPTDRGKKGSKRHLLEASRVNVRDACPIRGGVVAIQLRDAGGPGEDGAVQDCACNGAARRARSSRACATAARTCVGAVPPM